MNVTHILAELQVSQGTGQKAESQGVSRGWTSPGMSIIRPLSSMAMGVLWAACEMSKLISELKEEKEWKSESKHGVGFLMPIAPPGKEGSQPCPLRGVRPQSLRSLSPGHREAGMGPPSSSFASVGGALLYILALKTNLPR